MPENQFLSSNPPPKNYLETASLDFYQHLTNISNTIIYLQYDSVKFVCFKVYEARLGTLVNPPPNLAIQCQIQGNTYIFTREHFDQLSDREYQELLNHLKIDSIFLT
jgi:hypothetical protein